jgi:putative component of toxin-antitoxin plasmid stabilization module
MNTIIRTKAFDEWLRQLKDVRAKARIIKRLRSAERGNFGDCRNVGGGTKSRQKRDIQRARMMARQLHRSEC